METANKLADKTRELNAREEDLQTREEALRASEGLLEARKAQELAEARKEAERIREDAREEAKGIIARATAKASEMMAKASEMVEQAKEALRKIPLINKMMIGWAEKQEPEDRQATEDVIDKMTQYGIAEPRQMVTESEEEAEQRHGLDLLTAMTMLTEDNMDEAKDKAETDELTRDDVHDILQGLQDLHDDGLQR